jgi:hypothetical protein
LARNGEGARIDEGPILVAGNEQMLSHRTAAFDAECTRVAESLVAPCMTTDDLLCRVAYDAGATQTFDPHAADGLLCGFLSGLSGAEDIATDACLPGTSPIVITLRRLHRSGLSSGGSELGR